MQPNDTADMYYLDGLRIHAICADLHLPTRDAKLFAYIHIKAMQSADSINYFRKEHPSDVKAIELLLGRIDNDDLFAKTESVNFELAQDFKHILIAHKLAV